MKNKIVIKTLTESNGTIKTSSEVQARIMN